MNDTRALLLKRTVRFFYDAQKLRIQFGNRANEEVKTTELTKEDKAFLDASGTGLKGVEDTTFKEIKRLIKGVPIWEEWLKHQKGIGPTLGGVLVTHIHIEPCSTASKLWRWCGLAVIDGKAERRVKGVKAKYNPWLKAKLLDTMGKSFIKAAGSAYVMEGKGKDRKRKLDENGNEIPIPLEVRAKKSPWFKFYAERKHRRQHQIVETCMCCEGTGKAQAEDKDAVAEGKNGKPSTEKKKKKIVECWNCDGGKKPPPWGRSDAHREIDARRYMVKMFLLELWKVWRELEGLEVRPSYAEEYLGRKHHDSDSAQSTISP